MDGPPPFEASLPGVQHVWQLLQLHRPELALQACEHLLARQPSGLSALLARTEALRQLERLPEAADAAKAAVAHSPQAPSAFYSLAQVLGQQGRLREAELAMQTTLRLEPTNATYHGFAAQLYYLLRQYQQALASANAGLAQQAQHADCLLWRALAQEQRDQPSAADDDFHRLLRVAPGSSLVHAKLGQMLLKRHDPLAADRHLTEALRQAPNRAPELVPLLRQARRQQHWPAWLLRSEQQGVLNRARGTDPGLRVLCNRIVGIWPVARACWLTRHDPLFQLAPTQVWQRRLGYWVALCVLLPILLLLGDCSGLIDASAPLSIPQMVGLVIGGGLFQLVTYLLKKKITS